MLSTMRNLIFLNLLLNLASATIASAQQAGQLYITGYNKTQPFYFCKGTPQMTGQNVIFAFVNTAQAGDLFIDSFKYQCDTSVFELSGIDTLTNFEVGLVTMQTLYYVPKKEGDDTLYITGYYGPFSAKAQIICHAREAPNIAFWGIADVNQDIGLGATLGVSDEVLVTDTLHDYFAGPIYVCDTPLSLRHYNLNTEIIIRACGTRTIDRMYRVGDSSEIQILGMPQLPYTMHSGSELTMPFVFIPHVIGRTPHYFVVHTTEDDYLVWSLEYRVQGDNSVKAYNAPPSAIEAAIFPNPVSTATARVAVMMHDSGPVHLRLIDLLGGEVKDLGEHEVTTETTHIPLDLSNISNGTYLLLVESERGSVARNFVLAR
jgi:hypothetical protein